MFSQQRSVTVQRAVVLGALLAVLSTVMSTAACPKKPALPEDKPEAPVTLTGISPRTTSNATTQPLLVFGRGMQVGMKLRLGAPFGRELALRVDNDGFGAAVLPADLRIAPDKLEETVPVVLLDAAGAQVGDAVELVVTNDTSFPDVFGIALTPDDATACTVSQTTDALLCVALRAPGGATAATERIPVGDGPADVKLATVGGQPVFVVVHRWAPEIRLVSATAGADGSRTQRTIPGPLGANALLVDGEVAYVAEHVRDQLVAIDLKDGAVRWRADVAPNPRALALVRAAKTKAKKDAPAGDRIAVGSLIAGEVNFVSTADGSVSKGVAPRPGVAILGGHTEPYRDAVIGGKGVRALVSAFGQVFVASVGPLVGPNDKQMGVSGTGGVGIIDPVALTYPRHLAFNYGVPQAFALDEARGRLYVADIGEGLVHVVDAKSLASADEKAQRASWLQQLSLPLPDAFPLFRPREDFGIEAPADLNAEMAAGTQRPTRRRAGVEVHTGPSALALTRDAKSLVVLERFTGRFTVLDASGAELTVKHSVGVTPTLVQRDRRLGQVLYFADFGRTGMSCDSCHLEGHTEGVFFTKTGMMRIWKSSTVRGTRDTPPYFNPPGHPTLEDTASYVGSRNRFQNPPMSDSEVQQIALFVATLTTPPNPHRAPDGGLLPTLDIGGGKTGRPPVGMRTFLARCAGCHTPPLFSLDQDERTRRKFMKVPTPAVLEIRPSQQDLTFEHRTPPSLVAAWDLWPLFLSGAGGFSVSDDKSHLVMSDRTPLRTLIDKHTPQGHGNASELNQEARDDLLAFLLSL